MPISAAFLKMARSMLQPQFSQWKFMAQRTKVILIEDNENCREILATVIRLMGCEVIWRSGNMGQDKADVIVVYLDFPQMRTLHTIRALRDDPRTKDIPIIVFLPWTYQAATVAALDAGANDVFDGPLKVEVLQAGITKYAPHRSDECEATSNSLETSVENHEPSARTSNWE